MLNKVTCIIPFLNERERIVRVVKEIIKVNNIDQIICVDGGSTDNSAFELTNFRSNVKLIKLKKNIGKSGTVKQALIQVKGDYTLLYDADLENINHQEIEYVIKKIKENQNIDMIIFNRSTSRLITKINRLELIFSGERIVKTQDLIEVFKTNPVGFQLETAINTYMIKNKKKVLYFNSSNTNLPKTNKFGYLKGIINDMKMFWEVFKFNPLSYISQLLFFAREKLT